ncbi:MAG: Gfo/Idh/MocA family oxidoreductase [Planctomycetaceae bacterium]|nr:Gfo/Idh/MocA family oxidoreductase [Planctomycetaceae bacterium]
MSPSPDLESRTFRSAVVSVVKHDYVARGVARHPRFELVVVADDPDVPDWIHERNRKFADEMKIPYLRDLERAMKDYRIDVAIVSSEAERHCDLSVRAANLGVHVIQDKPMSTILTECDRLVEAAERNRIKTLIWNRNMLPAVQQASELIRAGEIGRPLSIHADFYFAKDAGPPKGSRNPQDRPMNWLELQKSAHAEGADGGVGSAPMGELQVEGIYPLAYMHLLTGAKIERVYARTASMFHQGHADNGVDDLATVSLEMSEGILGTLAIGRIGAASHPEIGEIKIHVLGTEGALVIAEARPEVAVYYRNQPEKEYPHRRVAVDNDFLLTDSFARAIDTDGRSLLDARTARDLTAAVEAAIRSGKSGHVEVVE